MNFFKDWLKKGINLSWSWKFGEKITSHEINQNWPTGCKCGTCLKEQMKENIGPKDPPDTLPGPMA